MQIAPRGARRDLESGDDLLLGQSTEIMELDHLSLSRRNLRERCQYLVESEDGSVGRVRQHGGFIQIHFERYPAAPARTMTTNGIHQDAPHHLRRDGEELRARLPF